MGCVVPGGGKKLKAANIKESKLYSKGKNQILALLRCYAAEIGSLLSTFRNNLSVPSSRVKQSKKNANR